MAKWLAENADKAARGDPLLGVIREGGPHHANPKSEQWQTYVQRLNTTGSKAQTEKILKFKA